MYARPTYTNASSFRLDPEKNNFTDITMASVDFIVFGNCLVTCRDHYQTQRSGQEFLIGSID